MKPKAIQRGIESPHARDMGPVPLRRKVSKLRDADPGGESRANKILPWVIARRRKLLLIWSSGLALATLAIVGISMMASLNTRETITYVPNGERTEDEMKIASKFASPGVDEAVELVKRAIANRDPAQVGTLIHPGEATPAEVIEFMRNSEERDGKTERYTWFSSMDVEGLQMEVVCITYAGKQSSAERLAFLTPNDKGVWKLDFDGFARSSKPSWKNLLNGRVDRAMVRVWVTRDAYFNGPFSDESQWICFSMASLESNALLPEGQQALRGYCKVGSAQAKAMAQIFTTDVRIFDDDWWRHRVTLEVLRVKGAEPQQFQITRVLGEDWVVTTKPFDEKFE